MSLRKMKSSGIKMRFIAAFLIMCFILAAFPMKAHAVTVIDEISLEARALVCGEILEHGEGEFMLDYDIQASISDSSVWVSSYDAGDLTKYQVLKGKITGGEEYTALITVVPKEGYSISKDTKVKVYSDTAEDYVEAVPLKKENNCIIVSATRLAEHDWDYENEEKTPATCIASGHRKTFCKADHSHVDEADIPIDPDAHQWSEWTIVKNVTKKEEGLQKRTCALCQKEETEVIPKITLPYTKVYEPNTSWSMAATIAWEADSTVMATAKAEKRPATAFVWLDKDLKVYDRDGGLISDDLDAYVNATVSGMIPAFYINDTETAAALKSWLEGSGLIDCFVVSSPDHKDLVKEVADLLYVRGMLDFSALKNPSTGDLTDMVAETNGAHGKVLILSAEAATRENIKKLQSLASTVWVKTPVDLKTLTTMYTNGVNGVVVDDYAEAIRGEELFADDAPSLLRVPMIIGHRGDPSVYVENTLDSAKGAYQEGVDSVENDIQLSADGELFILHDDYTGRLMRWTEKDKDGNEYIAEHYTLAELRAHPFQWDDILVNNEVPADRSKNGKFYGQDEQKVYTVPTLREYLQEFKGKDLVHDTEIKSYDPAILPVVKKLVDEENAWDQIFFITFNVKILEAIYRDYPELSVGALGMATGFSLLPGMTALGAYQSITEQDGAEAAVQALYRDIDQWNSTYNPCYPDYGEEMVRAARHRGLTVWPWTYMANEDFARDYMAGVTGLTTDEAWAFSDLMVEICSKDVTAASVNDISKPTGKTQAGSAKTLSSAEAVMLEDYGDGRKLMVWRYQADMNLKGISYGKYYLYSNPFVWTEGRTAETDGTWEKSENEWKYKNDDGTYVKNKWKKIDGKWYFFDQDGIMEKDAWREGYYLTKSGAWNGKKAVPGWKQNKTGWWYSLEGRSYLFDTWKKVDGRWYYFKADGYAAANEFVRGWWCNKNCVQKDPVKYSWHKSSKGWWYGVKGGWYAKNAAYIIDGVSYTFDMDGYCTNP